ncbi:AT-rich interactive domain-containing protein 4B-like isoform X2 [Drosophila montana]|uniref:AT-rich interactive domain-containing protein 4B-like isoform X2 n=1 Tax=Drosophila montana TaxID=40370 RepID=UPI00313D4E62
MANLLYWRFSRPLYTYLSIRYAGHRPLAPMIRHFHDDDSVPKDTKKHMPRPRVANKDETISTESRKLVDSKPKQKMATGTVVKLSIEQEIKALSNVVGSKQNSKDTISIQSHIRSNTTPKSTNPKTSSKSSQTVGDQSKDKADKLESNASAVETRVRAFVDSIERKKASNPKPLQSQTDADKDASKTTEKPVKSSPSPVQSTSSSNKIGVTKLTDKSCQASQTESPQVPNKEATWSSSQSEVGSPKLFDGQQETSQTKMSQKRSESERNLAEKNVGRLSKIEPQMPWEGMFGEHFKSRAKIPVEVETKAVGSHEGKPQSLVVVNTKQNSQDKNNSNDKLSQVEAKAETAKTKIESAGEAKSMSDRNIQKSVGKTKPEQDQYLAKGNPPKKEAPSSEITNKTILNPWKTETSSSYKIDKSESNQAQKEDDPKSKSADKTGTVEGNSASKSAVPQKDKPNSPSKMEDKFFKPLHSQTAIKTAVIKEDDALKDVLKCSNKHEEWIAKILAPPKRAYEAPKIKSNTSYKIEDDFAKAKPHQNKSNNKTDEASQDKSKIQSENKPTATETEKASKDSPSSKFKADDGFSQAKPCQKQSDNKSAANKPDEASKTKSKFDETSKNKSNPTYNVKGWHSKHSQNQLIKKSAAIKPDEASKVKSKSFNKDGGRFHKSKPSQSLSENKPSADKSDKTPKNKSNSIYKVTDLSSKVAQNPSTNKVDEASSIKDLSSPKKPGNDLLESFSAVRSSSISDRKFSVDPIKAEKPELVSADTVAEKASKTRSKSALIQDNQKPASYDRKAEIQQAGRPQDGLKSVKSAPETTSTAFGSGQKGNKGTIASLLEAVRKLPIRQEKAGKSRQEEVLARLKEKIKDEEKKAEILEILAEELRSRREAATNPNIDNKMNPTQSGDAPSTTSKNQPGSDREATAAIAAAIVKSLTESSATSEASDTIVDKSMPIVSLQELGSSCHLTSSSLGNSNEGKTSYGKAEFLGTDQIGAKCVTNVDKVGPDSKKIVRKSRTDPIFDKVKDDKNSNVKGKTLTKKTNKIKAVDMTPGHLYNSTTEGENHDFSKKMNAEDDDETLRLKAEQFLKESEARHILEKTKHINIEKLDVDKLGFDKLGVDKLDVDKRDVDKRDIAKLDAAKLDVDKRDVAKLDVDKRDAAILDAAKLDAAKPDLANLDVNELDVSGQQTPKPKLTISQYLYEMFMGKRKNNNESGRRNITTYSAVHSRNSWLDNRSKKSLRPTVSKKTEETFISPDLAKRQLGKEAILKERRSKSHEYRDGENDKDSRQRFDDVSCSRQLILPHSVCMPGISDQKQTLDPTLNDCVILSAPITKSVENLVNFTDDTNSTKILGGTPYKCVDKSLRAKLKNKKDESEIVIKGGSKKCSEKLKEENETDDDGECGKRSFSALARQLFQNLVLFISRTERKH